MSDHYYTNQPSAAHKEEEFTFDLRGKTYCFTTDTGVFSRDRVDFGSVLLIETMQFSPQAQVLDVGCGYGAMGLPAAVLANEGKVTMIDINERAVMLAKRNAEQNGIRNVEIMVSDLYEKVADRQFDVILTNPPIRAGKETVHRIFTEGYNLLVPGGSMWVVIQKKQGAPSAIKRLEEYFDDVQIVDKSKGYFIICARK
ncbi:class I SAM-dependent methyltransferase [Brevibacillus daliensis]|uniref:class I SAM-dependent methyltransferase n=1 Tax=Brevibacillus daliensis TaxID=2892995 RepID=UPI001E52D8DF|nr:class I SAM-dependent methyltransferase [Brevibacillus daliensis]